MRKKWKKTVKFFSVAEYEQEQEYLREQHKKGWKLVEVSGLCCFTFESCEPEDVVYQLDYNADRKKGMSEYIQMYQDCGWDYICDYVGYSYFRKPVAAMQEEEEIFNDNSSKLDMIDRVFKRRMIPLLVAFGLIICPQLYFTAINTDPFARYMFGFYCVLFVFYVVIFVKWVHMYRKIKEKR